MPVRDDTGRIIYWFGACTDIEDQKRSENALPRRRGSSEPADIRANMASPQSRLIASLRILVVDDNIDAASSLALLLKMQAHDVRTSHDGPSALAAADDFLPEVVLLDIGLPQMNGYDVARRLRERSRDRSLTLIAITGYGQDEDRRRALEAGFDAHLIKPADLAVLCEILAQTP